VPNFPPIESEPPEPKKSKNIFFPLSLFARGTRAAAQLRIPFTRLVRYALKWALDELEVEGRIKTTPKENHRPPKT
jgi:hypothetical protein